MADLFDRFYLPEDVGISSIDVANFLQECDKAHYKLRTLHIIRHGKAGGGCRPLSLPGQR